MVLSPDVAVGLLPGPPIPVWLRVHHVVDQELVPRRHGDQGLDGRHPAVAGVGGGGPDTVGPEAVVDLVTQRGGVAVARLKLENRGEVIIC